MGSPGLNDWQGEIDMYIDLLPKARSSHVLGGVLKRKYILNYMLA